jgi:hypothetical protein
MIGAVPGIRPCIPMVPGSASRPDPGRSTGRLTGNPIFFQPFQGSNETGTDASWQPATTVPVEPFIPTVPGIHAGKYRPEGERG